MNDCWIALGTNQGDRKEQIDKAVSLLEKYAGIVAKASAIYETEPWGVTDQPWFLNKVVVVATNKSPAELLEITQKVEEECGRMKREKWREREIDIDILFYGDERVKEKDLVIPHPEIGKRRFNLIPMLEIDPGKKHPVNGYSVKSLLIDCEDNSIVIPYRCKN